MSDFLLYLRLGFDHILDWGGYDHMLFLVVLVLPFGLKDWRNWAVLVTAFTLGHSLSLALVALALFQAPAEMVELGIAISILFSAIWVLVQPEAQRGRGIRYLLALAFGLVHGMGFSGFFRSLLGEAESILQPLFYFNLGIEIGQMLFVLAVLGLNALIFALLGKKGARLWRILVALVVVALSLWMVLERVGWN